MMRMTYCLPLLLTTEQRVFPRYQGNRGCKKPKITRTKHSPLMIANKQHSRFQPSDRLSSRLAGNSIQQPPASRQLSQEPHTKSRVIFQRSHGRLSPKRGAALTNTRESPLSPRKQPFAENMHRSRLKGSQLLEPDRVRGVPACLLRGSYFAFIVICCLLVGAVANSANSTMSHSPKRNSMPSAC